MRFRTEANASRKRTSLRHTLVHVKDYAEIQKCTSSSMAMTSLVHARWGASYGAFIILHQQSLLPYVHFEAKNSAAQCQVPIILITKGAYCQPECRPETRSGLGTGQLRPLCQLTRPVTSHLQKRLSQCTQPFDPGVSSGSLNEGSGAIIHGTNSLAASDTLSETALIDFLHRHGILDA